MNKMAKASSPYIFRTYHAENAIVWSNSLTVLSSSGAITSMDSWEIERGALLKVHTRRGSLNFIIMLSRLGVELIQVLL